jgi:hypothetical protein
VGRRSSGSPRGAGRGGGRRLRRGGGRAVLLVAVWVDPSAHDEAAVKEANRTATRAAVVDALTEHPAASSERAARREQAHNTFFERADEDQRIEVRRYEFALDPPFRAAWDPFPRPPPETSCLCTPTTLVRVASGAPAGAGLLTSVGVDPRRTEVVWSICGRSTTGAAGPSRSRGGIWSGARSASRPGGCWAVARTRPTPDRRTARPRSGSPA